MRLPDDEELVAYLDGEVEPPRREEIAHLLRISLVLRERLAALRRDMEITDRVLADAVPPEPAGWSWSGLEAARSHPARWRRVLGTGIAAAACAAVAVFVWVSTPPAISADDVLARAGQAEAARLEGVMVPVVHRRLRIVRTAGAGSPETATLDSWTVSGTGENRESFEPEGGARDTLRAELDRVLEKNRLDRRYLLSPVAYRRWRAGIHASGERLERLRTEDGAEAYSIATTVEAGGEGEITRSEFVVRAADWRPVANHLRVRTAQGEADYDIREMELAVLARAALPVDYFHPSVPARPAAPEPVWTPPPAVEPPAAPAPVVVAAPVDDEIEALYAVHRAGACDGDPVSVGRTAEGRVEVKGTVRTRERSERIQEWLAGYPDIRLSLEIAPRHSPEEKTPAWLGAILRAPGQSAAEAEATELSVNSLLAMIVSDARAVRRLTNDPSAGEWSAVSPPAQVHLKNMLQEHLAALEGNMRQMAELLPPASRAAPAAAEPGGDWRGQVGTLAEAVLRLAGGDMVPAEAAGSWMSLSAQARQTRAAVSAAFPSAAKTASAARD
jgi:hypothetical protein